MRAFHMNLYRYSANTHFPNGGLRTQRQADLRNEIALAPALAGGNFDIAGFTEVAVAGGAAPLNVTNALNDFGDALNIPAGPGGSPRHVAVIRCGRTALLDSNEVVALVINGNAVINRYDLIYFSQVGPANRVFQQVVPAGVPNRYTAQLGIPEGLGGAMPDYRYVVRVNFDLNGTQYNIGFLHNRAPGFDEVAVVMPWIRTMLENQDLGLCGGDFNTGPLELVAGGAAQSVLAPINGHHRNGYYSAGQTTAANTYDYWISGPQLLFAPGGIAVAAAGRTPNAPVIAGVGATGSDHRGVWLNID